MSHIIAVCSSNRHTKRKLVCCSAKKYSSTARNAIQLHVNAATVRRH